MSLKFDTQYFLEWFDKHDDELLVMEPEEIARKAFLAGMEAAQQSAQADGVKALPHEHNFSNSLYCSVCGQAEF